MADIDTALCLALQLMSPLVGDQFKRATGKRLTAAADTGSAPPRTVPLNLSELCHSRVDPRAMSTLLKESSRWRRLAVDPPLSFYAVKRHQKLTPGRHKPD